MTTGIRETTSGLLEEYRAYRELLSSLDENDLATATRCEGWDVHDVVAHVVGVASDSFSGRIGRFTPDEQASMRRDLTTADLVDELDHALAVAEPLLASLDEAAWGAPSGAPGLTVGEGILTLWYDAWLHRDDVHVALGRPSDEGPGLRASVLYLRGQLGARGWEAPSGVDLDGLDPYEFVLAATGRLDPAKLGLDPAVNIYA